MYKKKCPDCGENSYSSSKIGQWICSICSKDLTETETFLATHKRRNKQKTA